MNDIQSISNSLNLSSSRVSAAVSLLDEGNTIPFIARYRKEMTGELDEGQLRVIKDELARLRALQDRRETVLETIRENGKLTPELESRINEADNRTDLEDLYLPYKPKRETRASRAREKGLEPLADMIISQLEGNLAPDEIARPFLNDQVESIPEAWQGARDIAAEMISNNPDVRRDLREWALTRGVIKTTKSSRGKDDRKVYRDYYEFSSPVNGIRSHQVLAINRGENEKILSVKIDLPDHAWQDVIKKYFPFDPSSPLAGDLQLTIEDAAQRLLLPAISRDVRRTLTEKAENRALEIYVKNLRALLLQPPLVGFTVMGLDPGFRTGCKVAVVDPTGKPLDTSTIYPVPPHSEVEKSRETLVRLIKNYQVSLIAIGNGTASRDTEKFIADTISEMEDVRYLIVSEAGASVYSASKLAGRELPDLDVSLRGAVSIARRVQDPLAELVKIDPRSLGVGMYQHDVSQSRLKQTLEDVVVSVVNQVGVDLNTASPTLLSFISAIGPGLAKRIVAYRDQQGKFQERSDLLDVPGMGEKTFQQAAGFLTIRDGIETLDTTAIHPESYPAAREIVREAGLDLGGKRASRERALVGLSQRKTAQELAGSLNIGVPTLVDIFQQLVRPGRDPREDLPGPLLRKDVLSMNDLIEGQQLQGTVQNVVEFGAFVDLGLKNDGLLHRSKIPSGVNLSLGDIIRVQVLAVDRDRDRISLGWLGEK